MSVFYSINFNNDKSLCSKARMISDKPQTEAGKIHNMIKKIQVALTSQVRTSDTDMFLRDRGTQYQNISYFQILVYR